MSDSDERKRTRPPAPAREVLSSLPSHRPQRVTARRLSTRQNAANGTAPKKRAEPKAPAASERPSPRKPKTVEPAAEILGPRAPRQGFESEEIPAGASIDPPSAPQLLGSALELAGTLTQGTLTRGGRLLLGALQRLPRV